MSPAIPRDGLAANMTDIGRLHDALVRRALDGDGEAPRPLRRAAYDLHGLDEPLRTLVDKTAYHAYMVTDDDIASVRSAGLTEDQIFEIVVCAAIGQATRQYESGLKALRAVAAD